MVSDGLDDVPGVEEELGEAGVEEELLVELLVEGAVVDVLVGEALERLVELADVEDGVTEEEEVGLDVVVEVLLLEAVVELLLPSRFASCKMEFARAGSS